MALVVFLESPTENFGLAQLTAAEPSILIQDEPVPLIASETENLCLFSCFCISTIPLRWYSAIAVVHTQRCAIALAVYTCKKSAQVYIPKTRKRDPLRP